MGYSPPLSLFWGHIPHTPCHGGSAPLDPLCPPPWAEGSPAFWGLISPLASLPSGKGGIPPNFPPSLAGKGVRGLSRKGTSPRPPAMGAPPPGPPLPTLVGLGFASFLGPTHSGVARAGYSPFLLPGGHPPQLPAESAEKVPLQPNSSMEDHYIGHKTKITQHKVMLKRDFFSSLILIKVSRS